MTTIRQHLETHLRQIAPELSEEEVEGIVSEFCRTPDDWFFNPNTTIAVDVPATYLSACQRRIRNEAHAYLLSKGSGLAERFR